MSYRIKVETGAEAGTLREIPPQGLSVGRSSANDLVLGDELLSRRHCRITLQSSGPVVSDLATVNGTAVNGENISGDVLLRPGDRICIGQTVLAVSGPDGSFEPEPAAAEPELFAGPDAGAPLFPEPAAAEGPKKKSRLAASVAVLCAAIVLLAAAAKFVLLAPSRPAPLEPPRTEPDLPLEFSFVKTEGDGGNVFRYEMDMSSDGTVTVIVDDLAQDRHLRKTSPGPVSADARDELRRAFETSGFLALDPLYEGTPRQNTWRSVRISALYGSRAATVEVRNRTEPANVKALRERLEAFGRNELGLWAFAFGRDKLVEMAEAEFARGERLRAEREVRRENLHSALRAYRSCVEYLESLDPKPELHDLAVGKADETERELEAVVADLNWRADHAASTKDWAASAQALRELLDVIPDRTDERNKAALSRLRDAESRLSK